MRPVIFDMDGTLIDSEDVVTRSFRQTMLDLDGVDRPQESYRIHIGPPLKDSFASFGVSTEDIPRYIAEYRARYSQHHLSVGTYPGVPEMLERLHAAGVPMAIATSKKDANAKVLAEHLGIANYFVAVCGSDEDGGRAEKHFMVEDAINALTAAGHEGARALMVGDRKYDVEGAAIHGLKTVLVGWGPTPQEEFQLAWKVGRTPELMVDLLLSEG